MNVPARPSQLPNEPSRIRSAIRSLFARGIEYSLQRSSRICNRLRINTESMLERMVALGPTFHFLGLGRHYLANIGSIYNAGGRHATIGLGNGVFVFFRNALKGSYKEGTIRIVCVGISMDGIDEEYNSLDGGTDKSFGCGCCGCHIG